MSLSCAGLVLAGGLSRRMGGVNKSGILLGGTPLLSHATERLSAQLAPIAISNNDAAIDTGQRPSLPDTLTGFLGPLAGILAGLEWAAANGHSHIVSIATDTPFFPKDLVVRFLTANEGRTNRIVLATSGGNRHPVFGLWPTAHKADLQTWLQTTETNKVLAFVHRHDFAFADFDMVKHGDQEMDPFFNINTSEELATAEALLGETL